MWRRKKSKDTIFGATKEFLAPGACTAACASATEMRKEFEAGVPVSPAEALLRVRNLAVEYESPGQTHTRALDGISFEMRTGESIAVLGQSGSGKSTLALSILGMLPANAAIMGGVIEFCGHDLLRAPERFLQELRGARIAMVFQQPGMALNPIMRVWRQVAEVIRAHRRWSWSRSRVEAKVVLERVFGDESRRLSEAYPHELSGGQRQLVSIAQALACNPQLIIADEPTASLDAVVQARILKALQDLKSSSAMSLMLITHNPAILPGLVDRLLVMRSGKLVEDGELRDVYQRPRSAYTAELLRSIADPWPHNEDGSCLLKPHGPTCSRPVA